jgi:hypothetical protein
MRREFEPVTEFDPGQHVRANTTRGSERAVQTVLERLPA